MMLTLLLPALAFLGVYLGLSALDFAYAGVVAIPVAVGMIVWRLGPNAATLSALGLGAPKRWWIVPVGVIGTMAGVILTVSLIVRPLAAALNLPPEDYTALGALRGNPMQLAIMLAIAWTTAAIGEEVVFRGFLIPQIEKALRGGTLALVVAVITQAVLFGLAHSVQGPAGALQTGMVALVFGIAFVALGRNLWPLVLAHGLINTMSLVALYAGAPAG